MAAPSRRVRSWTAAVLMGVAGAVGGAAVWAAPFTPQDEAPEMFPDHPGRDEALAACSGCHGFRLVAAQGQTRRQWEDTLDWMTVRHGMPPLDGAERDRVAASR